MSSRRMRPTPSRVVAVVAVFAALCGGALAAGGNPFVGSGGTIHGCVGKGGALSIAKRGKKCAKKTTSLSFNQTGPRGLAGKSGLAGLAGPTGTTGSTGPIGPSNGYSASNIGGADGSATASVTVPAGSYVAWGDCTATNNAAPGSTSSTANKFGAATSSLTSSGDSGGTSSGFAAVPDIGGGEAGNIPVQHELNYAQLSNTTAFTLPNGGTITEECADTRSSDVTGMAYTDLNVTAVRVGTLN